MQAVQVTIILAAIYPCSHPLLSKASAGLFLHCMQLVPAELVREYKDAMLNIHPGLLPAFGGKGLYGLRVHKAVIASGARFSGATVHFVDEQYDTGPILAQAMVPVDPYDTPRTLAARVLEQVRTVGYHQRTVGHQQCCSTEAAKLNVASMLCVVLSNTHSPFSKYSLLHQRCLCCWKALCQSLRQWDWASCLKHMPGNTQASLSFLTLLACCC